MTDAKKAEDRKRPSVKTQQAGRNMKRYASPSDICLVEHPAGRFCKYYDAKKLEEDKEGLLRIISDLQDVIGRYKKGFEEVEATLENDLFSKRVKNALDIITDVMDGEMI